MTAFIVIYLIIGLAAAGLIYEDNPGSVAYRVWVALVALTFWPFLFGMAFAQVVSNRDTGKKGG